MSNYPYIPVFITEGLKKACALLTAGYVAIAIVGVDCGQRKEQLLPEYDSDESPDVTVIIYC